MRKPQHLTRRALARVVGGLALASVLGVALRPLPVRAEEPPTEFAPLPPEPVDPPACKGITPLPEAQWSTAPLPAGVVRFPSNYDIGECYLRNMAQKASGSDTNVWGEAMKAQGDIAVPAGGELMLAPNLNAIPLLPQIQGNGLIGLTLLSSCRPEFNDALLKHVARLTWLRTLDLEGFMITARGLNNLRGGRFQGLRVQCDGFGNEGLRYMQLYGSLKALSIVGFGLGDRAITDQGIHHLLNARGIEGLEIRETKITAQGIEYLANITWLKDLSLHWVPVDDGAVPGLCRMTHLRSLKIDAVTVQGGLPEPGNSGISDKGAERIKASISATVDYNGSLIITD